MKHIFLILILFFVGCNSNNITSPQESECIEPLQKQTIETNFECVGYDTTISRGDTNIHEIIYESYLRNNVQVGYFTFKNLDIAGSSHSPLIDSSILLEEITLIVPSIDTFIFNLNNIAPIYKYGEINFTCDKSIFNDSVGVIPRDTNKLCY